MSLQKTNSTANLRPAVRLTPPNAHTSGAHLNYCIGKGKVNISLTLALTPIGERAFSPTSLQGKGAGVREEGSAHHQRQVNVIIRIDGIGRSAGAIKTQVARFINRRHPEIICLPGDNRNR